MNIIYIHTYIYIYIIHVHICKVCYVIQVCIPTQSVGTRLSQDAKDEKDYFINQRFRTSRILCTKGRPKSRAFMYAFFASSFLPSV